MKKINIGATLFTMIKIMSNIHEQQKALKGTCLRIYRLIDSEVDFLQQQ